MKVFVVHRFKDREHAKKELKKLNKRSDLRLNSIFLDSSRGEVWEKEALDTIRQAEAIIVFNRKSCKESNNASWEIEKAESAGKEIVDINGTEEDEVSIARLKAIYELSEEFEECFSERNYDTFELYRLMIESSENLIQRRQKTNAFFITVIGSLLAIAALLVRSGVINSGTFGIVYGFSAVALPLCNSWRNLIENYGKLNKAKFDVILRLERELSAQIYSAEWVALGKGMRPKKYRSFTSTERNVPLYFALLVTVLTLIAVVWQLWD